MSLAVGMQTAKQLAKQESLEERRARIPAAACPAKRTPASCMPSQCQFSLDGAFAGPGHSKLVHHWLTLDIGGLQPGSRSENTILYNLKHPRQTLKNALYTNLNTVFSKLVRPYVLAFMALSYEPRQASLHPGVYRGPGECLIDRRRPAALWGLHLRSRSLSAKTIVLFGTL